ncbi:MAG: uracil-DNA glycosylase [Planctomycetaceae bacterium]|jgi:DNA polymerase|nr:uracil-DNA glycosylase [Planctomycetaceae bacterium]
MPHRIRDGLIDYLEIMQIAGVSELGQPVMRDHVHTEAVQNETVSYELVTPEIVPDKTALPEIVPDEIVSPEIVLNEIVLNEIVSPEIVPDKIVSPEIVPDEIVSRGHTEQQKEVIEPIVIIPKEKTETLFSEPSISMSKSESETKNKSKTEQLQELAQQVAQCSLCSELVLTRTQTVFGVGNPDSSLVFLGEAPGADEDKRGEPFVGRAGMLLNDIITKGMKIRREDVYICNILRCRPPNNRNPLLDEAAHCKPFLDKTLEIIKPKFICCLGSVAAKNLLQTENSIGTMRGKVFRYNNIKVICTYHPAYLLRNPAAKKQTWEDIKLLMREMGLAVS